MHIKYLSVSSYVGNLAVFQLMDYFITKSSNGLGWKWPYRSSRSKPLAMGRDTFH